MKDVNCFTELRYDLLKPNYSCTNLYNASPQINMYQQKEGLSGQNINGNNINEYISYTPYLSRNFSTPYINVKKLDLNQIYEPVSPNVNHSPLNSSTSIFNTSYLQNSPSQLNNYQLNSNSLYDSKSIALYSFFRPTNNFFYSPQTKQTSKQFINIGLNRTNLNYENRQSISPNISSHYINNNNTQNINNNMQNVSNNIQNINGNILNINNNIQNFNNNIQKINTFQNNNNINNFSNQSYFVNNKKDKIAKIEILEPSINRNLTNYSNNISTQQTFNTNNLGRIKSIFPLSPTQSINNISKMTENEEPKENFDPSEFITIKRIGEGAFGKIYLKKWKKNNRKYAMKKEIIKNNDSIKKHREKTKMIRNFLKKTGSKGVIKIYGDIVVKKRNENYYYVLMEIAEKDWEKEVYERQKYKKYYTEENLFIIISQLVKTLSLMQKNKITHRDIKPQNVLISKGLYKLTDFGEARTLVREGVIISKVRGTQLYMSPILFNALRLKLTQVYHNTFKSDVFSLGMCIFFASTLTSNSLCNIRELNDMKMIKERLITYLSGRYSFKLINILYEMLQIEEKKRPDFITLEKKYFT